MALLDESAVMARDTGEVAHLEMGDVAALEALYQESYKENWFDPRMVETGQYYGIRAGDQLVCAAGIHVFSPEQRVAALGNIATHPRFRRKGLASRTVARLCQSLLRAVDHVGLNVHADNHGAISFYEKLGFQVVAPYFEIMATRRETG